MSDLEGQRPAIPDDPDLSSTDDDVHQKDAGSELGRQQTHKTHPGPGDNDLRPELTAASSYLAPSLSLPREILFVAIVCFAQFMTQAGLGQTLSIAHIIGDHYGLSNPGDLAWFMAAYSLTVGTFILVSGRCGDLFGHKKMLITGYLWFGVWSVVAGLAVYSNVILFDFARKNSRVEIDERWRS